MREEEKWSHSTRAALLLLCHRRCRAAARAAAIGLQSKQRWKMKCSPSPSCCSVKSSASIGVWLIMRPPALILLCSCRMTIYANNSGAKRALTGLPSSSSSLDICTSWTFGHPHLKILYNEHMKHCRTQVSEDISF